MRRRFFIIFLMSMAAVPLHAATAEREVPPIAGIDSVLDYVAERDFVYLGKTLLFGYDSLESCVWGAADALLVKHYCDARNIPARALTLWSRDLGTIELYEEKFTTVVKRDWIQDEFPAALAGYFPADWRDVEPAELSSIMEKLYRRSNPACWSTSFSYYTQAPEAKCYLTEISRYRDWAADTQAMVNDPQAWAAVYSRLLAPTGDLSDIEVAVH